MTSILMRNLLGSVVIVAAAYGAYWYIDYNGYERGYKKGKAEIQVLLNALQAKVDVADLQAKETKFKQEKNRDEIETKHDGNVASVVAFYDRLLRDARKAGSSPPTGNPGQLNETTSECGTGEACIEFTRSCTLDAVQVIDFQDWARANQFPVQ